MSTRSSSLYRSMTCNLNSFWQVWHKVSRFTSITFSFFFSTVFLPGSFFFGGIVCYEFCVSFCDLLQKSGEMWLEPKSEVQVWNTDPDAIPPPPFQIFIIFNVYFILPSDAACSYILTSQYHSFEVECLYVYYSCYFDIWITFKIIYNNF